MAVTITVLHNQSLLDVAIQHTGSVANCFAIAVANGLSVSDDLTPGIDLVIPEDAIIDKDVLRYQKSKGIQPATGITNLENEQLGGIDYMDVEGSFKVS